MSECWQEFGVVECEKSQLQDEITRLRAENERQAETLALMIEEYDPIEDLWGNGCLHGFKPARDCPNDGCKDARLHRGIDAFEKVKALQETGDERD